MSFDVEAHEWSSGTRPCSFSLALDGGSVYADFDIDPTGIVSLLRVSFDGYGAWQPATGQAMTTMDLHDAEILKRARDEGLLSTEEVRSVLRRYFHANRAIMWVDALEQYGLLLLQ